MMKAVSLLSSGIDSPVASWMMKEQGLDIIYLHLNTDKADLDKVKRLKDRIDPSAKLVVEDFVPVLKNIVDKANRRYTCVLCKRAMYRKAEKLALKEGCKYIITGDNLGQVASQTLENLYILDKAVSIPVLKPLLCFDKKDTVAIARKIGTYDISSEKGKPCAFVPSNPTTRAKLDLVEREEERI